MGNAKLSANFKRDAVLQIAVRGYPVSEVSQRLGVNTHLLYARVDTQIGKGIKRPLPDLAPHL